jgi:hypothetical protein
LSFNESLVYKYFPKRKNNIYCQSIKQIYPKNIHMQFIPELKHNYNLPNDKYYGVNFLKLQKNYLEYRYLGGENYHRKVDEIILLMDYFILHLKSCLINPKLTYTDKEEFNKIMIPVKRIRNNIINIDDFLEKYKRINLTIDMSNDKLKLKTHWHKIICL